MWELSTEQKTKVLNCLIEGMSVRAVSRITGTAKGSILSLIRRVGPACAEFMDRWITGLTCERIELDECWAFVHAKDRNLPHELRGKDGYGSVWTWTAICPDCKLIPAYAIGTRDLRTSAPFIQKLATKFANRIQVTSDGNTQYGWNLVEAFKGDVDYAVEVKTYEEQAVPERADKRYSPARVVDWKKRVVAGSPDLSTASTSHMERAYLSMRMGMRRYTRLTNAFSKRIDYHRNAFAIWAFYYNFVRKHSALGRGKTPAMAAGIADHAFTMRDLLFAVDQMVREVA